ncbi:MAG: hypothetical protein KC503_18780, partial [Myxococcales bacterium]|nr:hypothetical protein [Myxococcales bacterium]
RAALDQRYEKLRAARVATARDALSRQPPDYAALLAAYQGLIGDQDRVVRELFGADAATKLRAAELRARAMVASVLAAFTKGAVPPW